MTLKIKLKSIFTFTLAFVTTLSVHANNRIEDLEIDKLLQSKNRGELEKSLSLIEALKKADTACQWQLTSKRLPYSCYELLPLAKRLKIKSSIRPASLDFQCEQIARSTQEMNLDSATQLSPKCMSLAKNRVRINRYKVGKDFD